MGNMELFRLQLLCTVTSSSRCDDDIQVPLHSAVRVGNRYAMLPSRLELYGYLPFVIDSIPIAYRLHEACKVNEATYQMGYDIPMATIHDARSRLT